MGGTMYNLFQILTHEADPKLTYKSNLAIKKLLSKHYHICNYEATFHQPADYYQLGTVEFKNEESIVLTAFYSIYIKNDTVYARLLTLDKVLVLDTPYSSFLADITRCLSTGNIPLVD